LPIGLVYNDPLQSKVDLSYVVEKVADLPPSAYVLVAEYRIAEQDKVSYIFIKLESSLVEARL
jgi:hypothetical protein